MIGRANSSMARRAGGFTLLEVMLAVALTVLLVGTMFAIYRKGCQTRNAVAAQLDVYQAERLIMDRITRELRSGMEFKFLQLGLQGDLEQASWSSVHLPGRAAWAIRKTTEDPIPPQADMQIVGYRLRWDEDDEGNAYIAGLERTIQRVLTATQVEQGRRDMPGGPGGGEKMFAESDEEEEEITEVEATLLSEQIKYISFRYWDGEQWQDSWDGGDFPAAVLVTLGLDEKPEDVDDEDYEGRMFRRIVYIPGGKAASNGGQVRGLGGM